MKVGDLVQEKLTMWSGDRLGRVGIVMEIAETLADVTLDQGFGAWVRWCGNVDWDIIYPEDVIILSKVAE
tara:strand:- start:100 stop:309 length:210 start_codon:yes stop_codon:yes gene_type:complete